MNNINYRSILTQLVLIASLSWSINAQADLKVIACFEGNAGHTLLQTAQQPTLPVPVSYTTTINQDCILINSISYSEQQTLNIGSTSSGAGAGKITFNPFTIIKNVDLLTPYLFLEMASGIAFKSVNFFFFYQPTNSNVAYTTVMMVQLGLAAIENITTSATTGSSSPFTTETLTLEYGELRTTVYPYDPSTGVRGLPVVKDLNRVKNMETEGSASAYITTLSPK